MRLVMWIAGAGLFTVLSVLAVAVFFVLRSKKKKAHKKLEDENTWMDSLDDSEWD